MTVDTATARAVLDICRERGVTLSPDRDVLQVKGALTDQLRQLILTHKQELIALLTPTPGTDPDVTAPAPDTIIPGPWTGPGFGGPCALCGIDDRWQDKYGILRCRACWPPTPDTERS